MINRGKEILAERQSRKYRVVANIALSLVMVVVMLVLLWVIEVCLYALN